ncbi:MAG: alginate O-acetyltransferase AlgX-related protein, partial [Phenylobacterium sp.]
GSLLGQARGTYRLSEDAARSHLTNLQARAEYLRARGAGYLVVAAPVQETIYPEFAPAWFQLDPTRYSRAVAGLAEDAMPGRVLYLEAAVAAAKAAGVTTFSRHDTHWTGDGAYAGYGAVMQALRAQGLPDAARPLSDFRPNVTNPKRPRDLARMIGVASFVPIHYRAYEDPAASAWTTTWLRGGRRDFTAPQIIDTGAVGKPVLLMQRDSFSIALLPFLTGHFSKVILTHIDDGYWRPDLVDRFKPDFVILEVQEAGLGAVLSAAPAPAPPADPAIEAALDKARALRPVQAAERRELADALDAPGCAVDRIETHGADLQVAGWISDLRAEPGYGRAVVRLSGPSGDFLQAIAVDRPRPDLRAAFRRPIGDPSGFDAHLISAAAPTGSYDMTIYRASPHGWFACRGPKIQIG